MKDEATIEGLARRVEVVADGCVSRDRIRKVMNAPIIAGLLLTSACVLRPMLDDDEVQRELDRVVCVYELDYADKPLTAEQMDCVYDVDVTLVRGRALREWCDSGRGVIGCYRADDREIQVSRWMSRPWELIVLRHELLHHLLWCTGQGEQSHDHSHPAFGGGTGDPPGSLSRTASGIAECRP